MRALVVAAVLVPLVGASGRVLGAEEEVPLGEIVVTATRLETPRARVAKSITVITKEEIEERQLKTVAEALREVPSASVVRSGSLGSATSIFLRGTNADQTLVLIDGVRVATSISGGFDLADLPTDNIERIEIVRGPQSTLFGSEAFGGVINIITRRGEGKPSHTLAAEGGKDVTFRERFDSRGTFGFGGYSLTVSRLDTGGFLKHDDYDNTSVSGDLDLDLGEDATLRLLSRYVDSEKQLAPVQGRSFDPNQVFAREFIQGGGVLEQEVSSWLDYKLSMAVTRTDEEFSDPRDSLRPESFTFSDTEAQVLDFDGQLNLRPFRSATVTMGGEWSRQEADFGSRSEFGTTRFDEGVTDGAFFGQGQLVLFDDRLVLVGGGRRDGHSRFGGALTGQFSGALVVRETGTKIRGSWGTGFKAPSLADLFFPGFANPDLEPEEAEGFDVGVEQALWGGRVRLEAVYFENDLTNLIEFRLVDPDTFRFQPENVARASIWGVEVPVTFLPLPNLRLHASYSLVDTQDEETGRRLIRRPRHTVFGQVSYAFSDRATASLSVLHVAERGDEDFTTGERVALDPYTKLDLAVSAPLLADYGPVRALRARVKIENLLDEDYEEAFGFPAPGLTYLFGLEASLAW